MRYAKDGQTPFGDPSNSPSKQSSLVSGAIWALLTPAKIKKSAVWHILRQSLSPKPCNRPCNIMQRLAWCPAGHSLRLGVLMASTLRPYGCLRVAWTSKCSQNNGLFHKVQDLRAIALVLWGSRSEASQFPWLLSSLAREILHFSCGRTTYTHVQRYMFSIKCVYTHIYVCPRRFKLTNTGAKLQQLPLPPPCRQSGRSTGSYSSASKTPQK